MHERLTIAICQKTEILTEMRKKYHTLPTGIFFDKFFIYSWPADV